MLARWLFSLLLGGSVFAQSALQQAVELTRQGNYRDARNALEGVSAPAQIPAAIAFFRLKAAIAAGLKEPPVAAREIEQALALAPEDSNLLTAAAVAELTAGLPDVALAHAQASVRSAGREALIGDIQEQRRDFAAATAAYKAAIQLAPNEERFRLLLGLFLIRHLNFDEAIKTLKSAVDTFPNSAKVRTLLGIAQFSQGYSDDAVLSLKAAISADPRVGAPYTALAKIVLQSSAAPAQSTVDCLCAWNQIVCSALKLRIARESGDQKLFEQASEMLKLSAEGDPIGRCELARAYEWQGKLTAAQKELEACVRLDPTPQNRYRLGLLYKRLGLTDLAAGEMARRAELLKSMSEQSALASSALEDAGLKAR